MLCVCTENTDPWFCLAAEEYFLKNFSEEIFMLWQSIDTVVVGKHQNVLAEINYPYTLKHNIKIARRISGGGTVFHDSGNVNFAYIKNIKNSSEINFSQFTKEIIHSLAKLGIEVTTSGRSDLMIGDKKISGNAEHIYKNRVLHHGTLLFSSNLAKLGAALNSGPGKKYKDKAVQSRRSEVTNISSFPNYNQTVKDFINFLTAEKLKAPGSDRYIINERDLDQINSLAEKKFRTWEWNFGYSPKYVFTNSINFREGRLNIILDVEKGLIRNAQISGDYLSHEKSVMLADELKGKKHIFQDIRDSFRITFPEMYNAESASGNPDLINEEFVYSFF
jgi:lipoate---protein ligase